MTIAIWIFLGLVFILGVAKPLWAFPFVFLSLLLGQLSRVALLGVEVPLLDWALLAWVGGWMVSRVFSGGLKIPRGAKNIFRPVFFFVIFAFLSLGLSLFSLEASLVLRGSFYLIRWMVLFGVFWLLLLEIKKEEQIWWFTHALVAGFFLFTLLGFGQLYLFPDFGIFEHLGWDPHTGRLLSTFFDPNFAGGFLVFGLALSGSLAWYLRGLSRCLYGFLSLVFLVAIFLTYSRSSLLALGVLGLGFGFLAHLAILGGGLVLGGVALLLLKRLRERIVEVFTLGQTALYRLESWKEGFILWSKNFIFGIGYNNLPSLKPRLFYLEDPASRAVSGFDSSLLTIAATTGVLGLISYLWLWGASLFSAWRVYQEPSGLLGKILSLAFLGGSLAFLVHSFFVNSLLFTPYSLVWWTVLALVLKVKNV